SSKGFVVGLPVVLDIYDDAQAQEAVRIVAVTSPRNSILHSVASPFASWKFEYKVAASARELSGFAG
uniref:hypothetical protein n=1 Tax=Nocardia cyriacigeorgica TaxID=135487 RepID=UPI002454F2E6